MQYRLCLKQWVKKLVTLPINQGAFLKREYISFGENESEFQVVYERRKENMNEVSVKVDAKVVPSDEEGYEVYFLVQNKKEDLRCTRTLYPVNFSEWSGIIGYVNWKTLSEVAYGRIEIVIEKYGLSQRQMHDAEAAEPEEQQEEEQDDHMESNAEHKEDAQ